MRRFILRPVALGHSTLNRDFSKNSGHRTWLCRRSMAIAVAPDHQVALAYCWPALCQAAHNEACMQSDREIESARAGHEQSFHEKVTSMGGAKRPLDSQHARRLFRRALKRLLPFRLTQMSRLITARRQSAPRTNRVPPTPMGIGAPATSRLRIV
jgi:hypothetical protein